MRIWQVLSLTTILLLAGCSDTQQDKVEETIPSEKHYTESEDVIKIEDKVFNKKEMEFYALMQKIVIEQKRNEDLKGNDEDKVNSYWDTQAAQYDNFNVQLQTLIEVHTMALLAKEKSYFIPPEVTEAAVKDIREQVSTNPKIEQLVESFGKDEFNTEIFPYMQEFLLKQRVRDEIEKDVRSTRVEASEQEISYESNTMYDDLYEDHVSGLELEFYVK